MTTPMNAVALTVPMPVTNRISENFSEKPKRRRGRPRAFTPDFESFLSNYQLLHETDTERSNLNQKYFHHAFHVLAHAENPERFVYLFPPVTELIAGIKKIPRKSILVELGHLDEEDMIEWAAIICREKWRTDEAIRRVRNWRLGREQIKSGDHVSLCKHIQRSIADYWRTRSGGDDDYFVITRGALHLMQIVHTATETEYRQEGKGETTNDD